MRIAGNFRGKIFSWLSINQFVEIFLWLLVDETTPVQDMSNLWVKYSCSGIEPRKLRIFVPRKLPAIRYYGRPFVKLSCKYLKGVLIVTTHYTPGY